MILEDKNVISLGTTYTVLQYPRTLNHPERAGWLARPALTL